MKPTENQIDPNMLGISGPKEAPGRIEDRYCFLCDKWFSIFQGGWRMEDGGWVWVCHGCQISATCKAIRAKRKYLSISKHYEKENS